MSRPKEFDIKFIVILFIILMAVLIFVKFRKDTNPNRITEEQKMHFLVASRKIQMQMLQDLQPMELILI